MNNQINTFLVNHTGASELVQFFGYASRGLPGLEIVGLGASGRNLKEKLIFISREHGVLFPAKRFVLCFDQHHLLKDQKQWDFSWLELPLLILFWSLSGNLPISRLDNCLSLGQISLKGELIHYPISLRKWDELDQSLSRKEKRFFYLANALPDNLRSIDLLDIKELFQEIRRDMRGGKKC